MPTHTAYELLQLVSHAYSGAQRQFVLARLQLRTAIRLSELSPNDRDSTRAAAMREAIRDICPDLAPQLEM